MSDNKLISINEVCRRTSLSRTSVHLLRKSGQFPAPIQITEGRKAFIASEVDDWINKLIENRNNQ